MSDDAPAELFTRELGRGLRSVLVLTPELVDAVHQVWADSRAAWPEVCLAPSQFLPYLAARMEGSGVDGHEVALALRAWKHAAELYLACGCAQGDAAALDAFERRYVAGLGAVVHRFGDAGVGLDDVAQSLREKLFVGVGDGEPAIVEYAGRGPLSSWVFVVATRIVLNLVRSKSPVAGRDDKILGLADANADQELAYLKNLYRKEFAEALTEAMSSLTDRDRTLLRQHYVDGVTLKQLASVHGVHRVTLVHWAERARDALRDRTHELLMDRLGVGPRTLHSIARLMQGNFGGSLRGVLRREDEGGDSSR
jgi:RNA polymerase sigma-70 factor (ECF subfamily)